MSSELTRLNTDLDLSEELPLAIAGGSVTLTTEVAMQPLDPPTSSQIATPDTPPPNQPPSTSHRKGGRPPNSRKGKLGKNQYTKDRDIQDGDDQSPARSQSRDVTRGDSAGNKGSNNEGKPGKSKGPNSKVSMGDMKKRVAAILGFISRTQVEMSSEVMSPISGDAAERVIRGLADGLPMIKVNGAPGEEPNGGAAEDMGPRKEFKDLSCLEMMDVLTRQLVRWQKEFVPT